MTETLNIPSHIRPELVVDFDYFNPPGIEADAPTAWRHVQQTSPDIFWTPRNGGHWVATRAEDIEVMYTDWKRFSNKNYLIPKHPNPYRSLPTATDPPEHKHYRHLLLPAFLPNAVAKLEEVVTDVAIKTIEDLVPKGECEFVADFARVLPIVVFLSMAGLPIEERFRLLPLTEQIARAPDFAVRQAGYAKMAEYAHEWVMDRRANPRDDLLSRMANGPVDGRPMTYEESMGMCVQVLFGGLDTVAALLSFSARFLAKNPAHRKQVLEGGPDVMRNAIEELVRAHALVNTGRQIAYDFEYKGIQFKEGEMVQLPNLLFGLDERKVEDPLRVDFTREWPIAHAAFGIGIHTCPGAILARREIRVFLTEWLSRIPDFEIKPGTESLCASGTTNSVKSLHLVWKV